nr:HGGxSTG domain-containing protein [Acidovorax delafieldii]
MTDDQKRRLLKAHYATTKEIFAAWRACGYSRPPPQRPDFPDELRGLTCGAKTRTGTACKQTALLKGGRCKLHGGCSTGPKSFEGKKTSSQNGMIPKAKRTP